jgi:hypothetical protein
MGSQCLVVGGQRRDYGYLLPIIGTQPDTLPARS